MSLSAAVIDALVEAGATVQQLAAAIKADLAEAEQRAANRRAKDAARQRKSRSSRAVTVTPRDTANGSPNEVISIPPSDPSVISDEMTSPAVPELKPEHVVEAWNATAERIRLRTVRKFTPERRRKLLTRISQNTIDDFTEAIDAIARSPFLRGENDRGWKADFDWMLEPKNFTRLIEGTYDRN